MTTVDNREFLAFVEDLKRVAAAIPDCAVVFETIEVDGYQGVVLSFSDEEEAIADALIREARKALLQDNPIDRNDPTRAKYTFRVRKSFVTSARCWSTDFVLSKRYELTEDYQL